VPCQQAVAEPSFPPTKWFLSTLNLDAATGSEGARMESKFGRDIMPFVFMAIFVGGLIVLAITGH
jgi:hypothetical protein